VLLNELALMLGGGAAGGLEVVAAGADDVVAGGGVVPPEELLPHAAAANPTATSATVIARLWVKGKVSSRGWAGRAERDFPRLLDPAFVQSAGPYD
jgi:hypothetical protein